MKNIGTYIKRPALWMLVVFSFTLLPGCKLYTDIEVKEVLDVVITDFSTDGLNGEVTVSITNPNWYQIKLKECHIDFTLDGKALGCADLEEEVVIPKKTTSTQTLKIKASTDQLNALIGNAFNFLFKSEFEMQGKGYVRAKAIGVSKNIPVDFTEKLNKEDLGF